MEYLHGYSDDWEFREVRFTAESPAGEILRDLACERCHGLPRMTLALYGMLLVAECICDECLSYWLLEIRAEEAHRLVNDPPPGLAPLSSMI